MKTLKDFWNSLPQSVKTFFVVAEGGAAAALLQFFTDPGAQFCFSTACLKHYLGAMAAGAVVAVRMYYRSSPAQAALAAKAPESAKP